jgi:hypothetical protein
MAIVYDTASKNARQQAFLDLIGGGTLEIGSQAFSTVLATIVLAAPAGVVANGVLTFTMPRSDAAADNSGTAATARIKDFGGTVRASGLTVGVVGSQSDINVNSLAVSQGQNFTINSLTITHG